MRDFRTWRAAAAQPRNRIERRGGFFSAADAVPGAVKSSRHTVASFTGLADAASHTAGSASRTADGFIHTTGSINRTADAANHPAGSFDLMAGRIIRLAAASSRTAGRASRANKSFIRTGKSSSRAVFRQKHAKTAPFAPPAAPTGQKATVAPCRTILVLTRHLTPATRMVPNPTTLIRPAATFSRSGGRRIFSPNSVGGEGETLAVSTTNQRLDWPDGHWQTSNCPKAFPSPVGRERVRVRAFPFSAIQPATFS